MSKAINKAVKILIFSDFILNAAWGLLTPFFSIFITEEITGGNPLEGAKVAGLATLAYWVTKSIFQIPIGKRLDENHGEKDDFHFMTLGTFVASFAPFGFVLSYSSCHIYFFQAIHAVGMAMAVPAWSAIITRHIDKGREAYEWSLRSTSLGFALGASGVIGGFTVSLLGFRSVFVLIGIMSLVSSMVFLFIPKSVIPR